MAGELRRVLDTTAATLPGTAPATAPRTAPPDLAKPRSSLLRGVFIGGAVALVATAAFLLLRPAAVTAPVPPADSERPAAVNTPPSTTVADSPVKAPPQRRPLRGRQPEIECRGQDHCPPETGRRHCNRPGRPAAESVFSRVVCIEKALEALPGHWGEIADCPSASSEKR